LRPFVCVGGHSKKAFNDHDDHESPSPSLSFLTGIKQDDEISFRKGDYVKVISKDQPDWWTGEINGMVGTFPSHCVEHPKDIPKVKNYFTPLM
jgi:hypothetical protein